MKQSTFSAVMANSIKNLWQGYTKGIRFVAVLTVLLTMGIGQAWGAEGDVLKTYDTNSSTFASGYSRKTGDNFVWWGQKGYYGANNATNHGNLKPTAADLPVVKAQSSSATTSTTGLYYLYTSEAVANVGKVEVKFTAKSGSSTVNAYVVSSSTKAASGSATWTKVTLASNSSKAQGANVASVGTYTFTFDATETDAKYYGVVFVTSSYWRATNLTFKLYEGAPSTPAAPCTVTFDACSGTCDTEYLTESSAGEGITLPEAEIDCGDVNWTFAGWAEASVTSETTDEPTLYKARETYKPADDITLYAVYQRTEGDGESSEDVTFTFSEIASANSWTNGTAYTTVTISPITITANGGGNNGKYYTSNKSWRMYNGGSVNITTSVGEITVVSSNPSKDFTITDGSASLSFSATTEFKSITVTYSSSNSTTYYHSTPECTTETVVTLDPNGGAGGTPSVTATKGEAMPTITPPTRTGYIFQGYFTAASDGTQYYNEDGTSAKDWDKTDETFTLYAQWECAAPTNVKITGEYIRFEGDDIVLTVSGDNIATDATYEWKKGDQVINNQTTATLTINNCTISDAGNYTCTVSNGICSASNNYTVKMYRLRGLTDPENNWTTDFVFSKAEGKTATYEITLNGDSNYKFKVHDGSAYYGNNEGGDNPNPTMTHDNCTNWTMQENKGYNVILQTTITGVYTFVLDYTDESNPTISVTYPSKQTIYFYPGTDYWVADNAKFTIYSWGGTDDATFTPMEDVDCGGIYSAEISTGYTSLIFIRYSDYVTSFDNYWNKTIDLTAPTGDKVLYDMASTNITHLYLKPNDNWKTDGARFAAYFCKQGDDNFGNKWMSMSDSDSDGIYDCSIPTDKAYPNVIFCRMNGGNSTNDWSNKWNQTGDLTIPTDGKNLFDKPNDTWNGATTSWSTIYDNSKWTTYTPNYTVTFNANGHGTDPAEQCIVEGGKATNPGNLSATGYTFAGWYKDADCTNAWDFANDVVTEDITLYAKWTANIHTLTWDVNGGNALTGTYTSGSVAYGTVIVPPATPTRTGHTFLGWKETDGSTTIAETMPDKDLTYTAQWQICLYTLTWDLNGGTVTTAGTHAAVGATGSPYGGVEYGASITAPIVEREGYRFDGWHDGKAVVEPATTMGTTDLTYTAQWTEVYTVTWYENGVPSYTYVPSDNPVVTWEDNIADCGEKKFYGWTADDTFVSDPTTPPTLISKGTTIAGDVTYFAVYADATEPANPGYEKVITISEGTYLIATDATTGKAYTGKSGSNNYGGYCAVEIENDVISEKPDDAVEVIVTLGTGTNAGKFAIYDGTYYLSAPNGNSITFNNGVVYDWNLTNEGYIHSNGNSTRYLQYNSSAPRFACYEGAQKYAYLYKKQTTTYANFAVSCATYDISVTTPTGGTVTTNPADEAGAGQTITVNVTPADCKYLTALKYNDGSDHNINIASIPYTFTMPAADVTVTATFADKNATDIEVITSAHRMLMQGSAFVGEQVRITYNNGDKETLNWNDSRLTFTGYNTATLGSQTVTVTYNDCGTQSASYNIEVIDGLGITFWDGNYTEVVKYEPGDLVDVDNRIGQNICSGWEFAGWSETQVANESEEYVPVHNFNATDAKVLYAVYVKKKAQWTTIVTADEAKSGAKYVLAYNRYGTYYALTSSVKDVNYLAGKVVTSTEGELNSFDVYYLSAEPTADLIWELISTDENGKWYLYNKNTAKYIDLSTQGQIHLTDLPSDKLQMESGYNDSQIRIASSTVPTYYLSWDNSNTRYNTFASSNSQEYWYTKDEEFTSTPPCSPLSATFHGNGGVVTDGVNSGDDLTITEPTRDAGITTPTASFADCNGKSWTFVGWSLKEIDVTRVPVLTTDLLHDGGGNKQYEIQEDGEEFWAVYTNTGDPETKYGTITFTDDDVTTQYENAKTITKSVTAMGDYDFELYHVSDASSLGIQFDHNSTPKGYIKNITSLGKINSISLNDFQVGDIDDVKVYVGNMPNAINTLLTEADLQQTGNTYTYYPPKNYAYVKIEANGYCGITSISIDFGKGTQIWATTPDCSTITLSGDEIYVTATNGRAIMASAPIAVKANQLEANADVILTSNSDDVYFSLDRSFNFAAGQAAGQKPKTSLTLPTDAEGNLATTDVYIHYMPSSEGDGVPANVIISANLETPNPSITDDHTIHVRNLPAKFVIATKVGATWYALPANMTGDTNPLAEVIEVDEAAMTATAPNTTTYTLWPVKTTNGTGNRYADYGDRLRFAAVNYEQRGLWANNNNNSSAIRNYAVINSLGADALAAYEWKVTTTVVDGHWQYTLQTDQTQNQNYLRYWTSAEGTPVGPKWGTYNAGENKLYFLPVTETQPFEYAVVEWYPTKMLIQTDAAITSPTVKVRGEEVATPVLTSKGGKLYEISNLPLETNPNEVLQVSFTADAVNYVNAKVVPIILSRGAKSITGEPFAALTQKVYQYADVVVRDGATLTIDGGTDVANTLLSVTIYPTAKVSVAEGKKLSVHSLTFFGGIDEIYDGSAYTINKYGVPQLSLKGILNKTVTNIDYIMRVNLDQMYQVGVPYNVNLNDITYWDGTTMTLGDNLYVSAYDGQKRANREEKSWVWEVNFTEPILKAGIGYTISADMQAGVGNEYSIIRMPMKNNITSGNTETAKTVQVYAYDNTKGVEITDNHKGWNYLSNPYMVAISGAEADSKLVVGYLRETGTGPWEWVDDTYRYVTIPSDDGKWYDQQKFEEATLLPFKSFFLQIARDGELSFALASRQNAPARYLQNNNEQREVEFEVLLANDTRSDNLGFLIGEDYTPAYEINADLEKMIGSMSVYTIYNGYNLAYNALSPANAEEQIPIGYVVPTVGEYTFALDESSDIEDIEHIYLFDYETSAITDLVTDVYTFTALEQKSDTRFAINVALKSKDNAATGLDNMDTNGELPTKFIYQDKIFILHHGVIYDATGKRVITINK